MLSRERRGHTDDHSVYLAGPPNVGGGREAAGYDGLAHVGRWNVPKI
jgi:hypothetical protein